MGGALGFNKQSSESNSRPLTAQERADIYEKSLAEIQNTNLAAPAYTAPTMASLSGGDFNTLQSEILKGNTAGLDYAKAQDLKDLNNNLAKRGIWSSGLAEQAVSDLGAKYAPQYAKAGADATATRYNLESNQNQQQNAFNMSNAQNQFNSQWRPLDFMQGLWNGTGGAVSSGSGSGWGFNIAGQGGK